MLGVQTALMEIHGIAQQLANRVQQAWELGETPERFRIHVQSKGQPGSRRIFFLADYFWSLAIQDIGRRPLQNCHLILV